MSVRIVKLPDVGEGVAEAEIVEWHVAEGDLVAEDQTIAAVMTDKATVEIPSPVSGKVVELGGEVGDLLAVGSKLVAIEPDDLRAPAKKAPSQGTAGAGPPEEPPPNVPPPAGEPTPATASVAVREAAKRVDVPASPSPSRPSRPAEAAGSDGGRPLASPAVRRRALDRGIDLRRVAGSGPAGRILHEDLDAFMQGPVPAPMLSRREGAEEVKLVGLRRRIAGNMAATRAIAHFSYVEEVDVTALEELRAHLNTRQAARRPKLTLLPFIVRALVVATEAFPQMNALYDDERQVITRHRAVHAGIAAQTPSGLMVPVLRHAEAQDLWTCAGEIARLADAARDGSAKREELTGSTITITSLGPLGGIVTTPVINKPEVAIIGVNKIAIRPVWRDNQFVPRRVMNLSTSFDHRVIDGHDAASFVQRIRELLENPATLFIGS